MLTFITEDRIRTEDWAQPWRDVRCWRCYGHSARRAGGQPM